MTDLPLRQTLYFSEGEDNLLLASYNDMVTTVFWNTLQNNFDEEWHNREENMKLLSAHGRLSKILIPEKTPNIHHAKKVVVKELLSQLRKSHQTEIKEEWLKECVYQFWGGDIFGGGYHQFNPGYDVAAAMRTIRQPWENEDIHIVGEAYSNLTGWVEGAYQTS